MTKKEKAFTGLCTLLGLVGGGVGTATVVMECYNTGNCESKITNPTVQVDTVRDAPPPSAPFVLELISLRCNRRQERHSDAPDEIYFKIMDQPVLKGRPVRMDVGHMVYLDNDHPNRFPFVNRAEIELWDRDTAKDNPDEYLGNTFASASDSDRGELTHVFTGSGASYVLKYRVETRQ